MCFPAPGPRCSAHAYQEFLVAKRRFLRAASPDAALRLGLVLEEKQLAFDATPRGIHALRREVDARPEQDGERLMFQHRMEAGVSTRETQMAAYRAASEASREIRDRLRGSGMNGRYEFAAAVAYAYMSVEKPDREWEIENLHTLVAGEERRFVVPQKYQDIWGEVGTETGYHFPLDAGVERLLNERTPALHVLDAGEQRIVFDWFVGALRDVGYTGAVLVDTRSETARRVPLEALPVLMTVGLTLREKRGGSTAWTGELDTLRESLRGTPFERGTLTRKEHGVVLTGVGPQSRRSCAIGEHVFMSWNANGEDFLVRRTHHARKSSLIVKLALRGPLAH